MEANGLLLVMMRPPAHLLEEYNEWYDTEHLADRMSAPGFLSAHRFQSVSGGQQGFLTVYDLASVDVMDTPEYHRLSRENFTPWTRRLMRRIPRLRIVARQIHPGGRELVPTPFLTMLRFGVVGESGDKDVEEGIRAAFADGSGVMQVRLFAETQGNPGGYVALIGSSVRIADRVLPEALGPVIEKLVLVEEFAPHAIGLTWEKWI